MNSEGRREIAYWQHLLVRIAEDLERTAASERQPQRRDWLLSRSMRIRQRLHEGVPASFREPGSAVGMTPQSHMVSTRRDASREQAFHLRERPSGALRLVANFASS